MSEPLPRLTRLWFAWLCFFKVLFDAAFAARIWDLRTSPVPSRLDGEDNPSPAATERGASLQGALQLLSLLQREGRLLDFLEQNIAPFKDDEIGATARVVHEGCRTALRAHAKILPLRPEEEGTAVTLPAGFNPQEVKLTGNVRGNAPYGGVLRHRGWRVSDMALPVGVAGHDSTVICAAEVEL